MLLAQPLQADDAAKAQKLIDRAIQAMGGNKALEKTRNTIFEDKGTYHGMGAELPYEGRFVFSFPGRYRMEISGEFVSVTDGDKAWVSVMGMTMDLDGVALETAKAAVLAQNAMSLIPLQKPNKEFKLSLAEAENVEGEDCEGINIDRESMPTCTIHFSKKTGLVKKTKCTTKASELDYKEVTDETIFHEYKEVDGVLSVMKMSILRDGKKYVESNVSSVSYPETLDASEFKKPE
jgi:outer membrane lipoprotein-sorting protein